MGGAHRLPHADDHTKHHCNRYCRACGESDAVPSSNFLQPVKRAGRTRGYRVIAQMPFNVRSEAVDRLVTATAVFFQRLHGDPVQVAPYSADEFLLLL